MLSGEGENNNRSNWQKNNFARAEHFFFVHFFAVVLRDYNVKVPETFFMEVMSYVFSFTFFSLLFIFSLHWWPLGFLILSPPLPYFHVVLPTKNVSFVFFTCNIRQAILRLHKHKRRKNTLTYKTNYKISPKYFLYIA